MKKTYLRATVASIGLFTGTLFVDAQTAGGSAAGGGATATSGATAPAGQVGQAGTTVGGASVVGPAGSPTVGAASVIEANPNTVGGNRAGIVGQPGATPTGTLPSGVGSTPAASVPLNTLPATVQNALQGFSANGSLGSVTAVPGQPGMFRATVTQNGVPMELTVAANGRVVSRVPVTGSPGSTPTAATAATAGNAAQANAQAGVPLGSLPASVQSQLAGAQVQSVSRDDLANGSIFRVTAMQNGVPTELRFSANGTLLSSTPLVGAAATAGLNPNSAVVPGGTIIPGAALVMDDLPATVRDSVRAQLGAMEATRIMQQRGTNGVNYVVSYNQDGRAMTMVIGPDGRVLSNGPANVTAVAASTRSTSATASDTRATLSLDELPDNVEDALKEKAPHAEVRTITREKRVGGDVYVIAVRDGDRAGEIEMDADGKIIRDDRRDLSAISATASLKPREERPEGMAYETLPVAIQNAIKAYATASDIRSITLGLDRDGKTVYDVVFYRDGRRDRMIVNKMGRLVRMEKNVAPAFELASRKPAVIAVGDLPQQVQDTIRRQTDNVLIKDINTKEVGGERVYQVSYKTNGTAMELLVNNSGEVVLPQGDPRNDREGAPLQADVDKAEPDRVRVVDASKTESDRPAAGAFAGSERASASASAAVSKDPVSPAAEIKLSDTPEAVQNTIKKMTGSGSVERITPKITDSGFTYEVNFMEDGKPRTVILDRNGVVQNQKGTSVP